MAGSSTVTDIPGGVKKFKWSRMANRWRPFEDRQLQTGIGAQAPQGSPSRLMRTTNMIVSGCTIGRSANAFGHKENMNIDDFDWAPDGGNSQPTFAYAAHD
jgi:hypothetical protein